MGQSLSGGVGDRCTGDSHTVSHSVTQCHTVSHSVTQCHTVSHSGRCDCLYHGETGARVWKTQSCPSATSHQSPVTSHQSPVPSHQSPVTSPQSPAPMPPYCV